MTMTMMMMIQVLYAVSLNSTLYKSIDEGASWSNEMVHLAHVYDVHPEFGALKGVQRVVSASDDSRTYIQGWGEFFWTTVDKSHSYTFHSVDDLVDDLVDGESLRVQTIIPHPTQSDWALFILQQWDCIRSFQSCNQYVCGVLECAVYGIVWCIEWYHAWLV
jgi:hypothetical protein